MTNKVTAIIDGADQWSDTISIPAGNFSMSVAGTFVGTITVQRTFDSGVTWGDAGTFTTPEENTGFEGAGADYRIGAKAGEFTSGEAKVLLLI